MIDSQMLCAWWLNVHERDACACIYIFIRTINTPGWKFWYVYVYVYAYVYIYVYEFVYV